MAKVLFLFVLTVLLTCATPFVGAANSLTRDQAISVLIQQVINSSPNKETLMAFGPQNMLSVGDTAVQNKLIFSFWC